MAANGNLIVRLVHVLMLSAAAAGGFAASQWYVNRRIAAETSSTVLDLLIDSGDYAEAETRIAARLRTKPADEQSRMLLARVRGLQGDPKGFAEEMKKIGGKSPFYADAQMGLGASLLEVGDAVEAEKAFRQAIENFPRGSRAWVKAGGQLLSIFGTQERHGEIRELMRYMIPHLSGSDRVWATRYITLLRVGREEPAVRAERLKRWAAGNPSDFNSAAALASAYLEMHKPEEARALLEPAIKSSPDNFRVWRSWLRALHDAGDYDAILKSIETAPAAMKEDASYWKIVSIAQTQAGQLKEAAASVQKSIELAPDQPHVYLQAVPLLTRVGKTDLAEQYRKKAADLQKEDLSLRQNYRDWEDAKDPQVKKNIAAKIAANYAAMGMAEDAAEWKQQSE